MADEMLSIKGVSKSFGGILAADKCNLTISRGTIVGLIGPNGAGKSTLFDIVSGFQRPDAGSIAFQGKEITGWPAYKIARLGLIRTFQIPHALTRMTVLENMMLGKQGQIGERICSPIIRFNIVRAEEKNIRDKALEILEFFDLGHMKDEYAGSLSGGQKKLLEMARSLMADPQLLLLDEPFAGVNPSLSERLIERIKTLRQKGLTIMIIEHGIPYVLALSDWVYVLNKGAVMAYGKPDEVVSDKRVLDDYLGDGCDAQT
ncbi:putative branched-chain amino acid transport ATP-binding protein LivG [uncultured archaeon]|nr:putative branched-chain amino acid transport ATP-binding protein LivG [uncultured archaeon]